MYLVKCIEIFISLFSLSKKKEIKPRRQKFNIDCITSPAVIYFVVVDSEKPKKLANRLHETRAVGERQPNNTVFIQTVGQSFLGISVDINIMMCFVEGIITENLSQWRQAAIIVDCAPNEVLLIFTLSLSLQFQFLPAPNKLAILSSSVTNSPLICLLCVGDERSMLISVGRFTCE